MKPVNVVTHVAVPRAEPQKVLDLVDFTKKSMTSFATKAGESLVSRLDPVANKGERFAIILGVTTPRTGMDELQARRDDLEKFAETRYLHFSRAFVLGDTEAVPVTYPSPERL
jgi:hypothetical protein